MEKKKKKNKFFLWTTSFPFRPEETQKQTYFHERKSKCMSMRRHRASLFMEQSVFLPGRPRKRNEKEKKTLKLNWWHFFFFSKQRKWSFRLTASSSTPNTEIQVIQYIYINCIYHRISTKYKQSKVLVST